MTLEKAISFAIEKEGIGIISEVRFVNYLNDLQAFDRPAMKRVVQSLVSGGYSKKLKQSLTTQNYELDINDTRSKLVNIEGFQADLVEYVLNCLLFATKKTTKVPVIPSVSSTSATTRILTTSTTSVVNPLDSINSTLTTRRSTRKSFYDKVSTSGITNPHDPIGEYIHYRFPTLDLLSEPPTLEQDDPYKFLPMRYAIASRIYQETKAQLPICLGVSESNDIKVIDLASQPHLLIAGSTGTGKSVFLHSIILSMLYRLGPADVKFVLIDPQRVEFSCYASLEKYYLAKSGNATKAILSESDEVTDTLKTIIQDIDKRYNLLEEVGARDIQEYNKQWRKDLRHKMDNRGDFYQYLPRIVIIIDEFSSYAQNLSNFQNIISNIAGKGRAVGVHLILSTNAVGTRLLTPAIKALFPSRIAFDVPQAHESNLILDCRGAENLNHRGRLIFKNGDTKVCLQSPHIDSTDITNICYYIKEQEDNDKEESHKCYLLGEAIYKNEISINDRDPLFEEIARLVVQKDIIGTSSIQRSYNIGYNRAGRIMDQLEAVGIVGPASGGKPRTVLMTPIELDQLLGGNQPTPKSYLRPSSKHTQTPLYTPSYSSGTSTNNTQANTPPKKTFRYYLFLTVFWGILIAIAIFLAYILHLMGS